ncbi:MAG TPA: TonB family protein [Blastocatellia bacterium]|nr:TonB family protein [Blastocatellia bacterium]
MICLDEGILRAHLDGELTEYEMLSVNRHLSLCDDCHRSYETIAARVQSLNALLADLSPSPNELRTDSFAAQCAFTRFKAQYEVDFDTVTFIRPVTANLHFVLPESGNLLARLRSSAQQFVRDFGKRLPRSNAADELRFLLPDEALFERLPREARANWEEFKRNPQGFLAQMLRGEGSNPVRRRRLQSGMATAMASYLLVFTTLIVAGALNFNKNEKPSDIKQIEYIKLSSPAPLPTKPETGPDNVPSGKGGIVGGSKAQADPARGGGGGGRNENTLATRGNPPQMTPLPQVMPPNPEPIKTDSTLVVPETTVGDPALSRVLPRPTGLKEGADAPPSSGPGSGAGIGTNQGTGVGPGAGSGLGLGRINNQGSGEATQGGGLSSNNAAELGNGVEIFDATYNLQPRILSKQRAAYTEEARTQGIRGSVMLNIVFGADGKIYNIQVVRGLPQGLTESAIEAAKKIKFRPAIKNGTPVNVRMQVVYEFNLL